jgi:hypothetical protein
MPVLMISEVAGQTADGYAGLLGRVGEQMKAAPGLLLHMSHPSEGGWRVIEVWETREHSAKFFAAHIAPNLPAGVRPKLTFQPLHDCVVPGMAS